MPRATSLPKHWSLVAGSCVYVACCAMFLLQIFLISAEYFSYRSIPIISTVGLDTVPFPHLLVCQKLDLSELDLPTFGNGFGVDFSADGDAKKTSDFHGWNMTENVTMEEVLTKFIVSNETFFVYASMIGANLFEELQSITFEKEPFTNIDGSCCKKKVAVVLSSPLQMSAIDIFFSRIRLGG